MQEALQRSGRKRSEVTLVAVSKKFSAEHIQQAYAAGIRDFGENYVQEFADKYPALSNLEHALFHFIGHLQTNKARLACQLFHTVETVDSIKLLERLEEGAKERGRNMDVLCEVKLAEESSKTGLPPGALPDLLHAASRFSHLNVSGLMTIPPWSEDPESSRPYFRQLAELAKNHHLKEISMGMSGDFEVAIEEGATVIRVGTALFGRRPKPAENAASATSR